MTYYSYDEMPSREIDFGPDESGIHVTSLVDSELVDLYDEIMKSDPAERTIAEEAFIEYVAERLVAEVADQDVFVNDEGVIPRCDICAGPQLRVGDDWNGETGNHFSCESKLNVRHAYQCRIDCQQGKWGARCTCSCHS